MISKAVAKLKAEIDSNKNNSYVQVIGGFLLGHLDKHPEDAEKIMAEGKTIAKSLEEMRKEASKKKTGNFAMLTDQEGYGVVLKYFGIKSVDIQSAPVAAVQLEQPTTKPKSNDFDISLAELL